MKFDDLYNRVFISEQDEPSDINTEVAHPDDFDDVEPIPVPQPATTEENPTSAAAPTAASLTDYMKQCLDFAEKLQSPSGECLQSLVISLNRPATPFEGIDRLSADIEDAAEKLKRISGRILSFTIAAQKVK